MTIPGYTTEADLKVIEKLACNVPEGGIVIEVGAWLGRSTWVWSKNTPPSASVYVVDDWAWMPSLERLRNEFPAHNWHGAESAKDLFNYFTSDCANIKPTCGKSTEVEIPDLLGKADVVYIDAGHGEYEFKADILHWRPYVKLGGIFAGDDYWEGDENTPPTFPGIVGMLTWLSKKERKVLEHHGTKQWILRL